MTFTTLKSRAFVSWVVLIASSTLMMLLLELIGIPGSMLLGPIAVGIVFGLRNIRLRFSGSLRTMAQGITGVLIAQSLRPDTFLELAQYWEAALSVVGVTLLAAIAVGALIGRFSALPFEEAVWGFLPGMATAVIAMSEERKLDARAVAVVQVVRLLVVIVGMSILATVLRVSSPEASAETSLFTWEHLVSVGLVAISILAHRYATFVPAAAMMVPMMAGVVCKAIGLDFALPHEVIFCGYFVIGAGVGLGFDLNLIRSAGRALPALVGAAVLLVTLGASMGAGLGMLFGLDPLSSVLSAVPGSVDAVAAIAYSTGSDLSFIMALQVFRLFAVVMFGPPIARYVAERFQAMRAKEQPEGLK
ncbi:AbrB family transcriptional regulator [Celeribacter litoreus]|uniref:AbrB family transcriptional regulator n=1 Tax=Celeribacter litoreus TaxID=2876714 RepID=UPI001CC90A21|nr:AbrB family transcriptional regulator [Celeribacter litoreus]MCA0042533.1 AbrB family transcriptional regulator [Celeribacter litoreus]